jgi:hypothetical protein
MPVPGLRRGADIDDRIALGEPSPKARAGVGHQALRFRASSKARAASATRKVMPLGQAPWAARNSTA